MELTYESKVGAAKGTAVEEAVKLNFQGECAEVGLYLAMSRQALREGFPETAAALEKLAWDEAWHAARFAELNGLVSTATRENIERMLKGEQGANKSKHAAAVKAQECRCDEASGFFDESARDEARHARALQGLLNRYFANPGAAEAR